MKELEINGTKAKVYLDEKFYPLVSVKKAMFNYLDRTYMVAKTNKKMVEVDIELIDNEINLEDLCKEFINDCLRETLRYDIVKETKNIRELIIGRALYTSCMEVDDKIDDNDNNEVKEKYEVIEDEEDFNFDDIAVNWFDNNKQKEDN